LRLPTALAGICFILLIWATTVRLAGRTAGAVAAAMALASPHFVDFVRHIWVETPVATAFAGGLLLYAVSMEWQGAKRALGLVGVGVLFGTGLLLKQAFAGFAPVAMAVAEVVMVRRRAWRPVVAVAAVTLAVSLWWFVWTFAEAGALAEEGLLNRGILMRFTMAMDGHGRHPNDYATYLDTYSGLASWLVGVVGWIALARPASTVPVAKRLYVAWSILLVLHYVVVGLALRTVAPWYQFPVVLPLFAGTGYLAVEVWKRRDLRWLRWLVPLALVVSVARSLRLDEVKAALLVAGAALGYELKPMCWLRQRAAAWQLLVAAALVLVIATEPWTATDARQRLAAHVTTPEQTLAVGHRAKWRVWRSLLPAARVETWPGSCEAVAERAMGFAQVILEAPPGVRCQLTGFRLAEQSPEAGRFERTTP
jgi:4-amino-4-deoxy-L-arabinose transferase-like glycosyltransferase